MAATLTREAPVDLVTGEPLIRIEFGFTFPPLNLLIALVGTLLLALLIMQLPLRRAVRFKPGDAIRYA
jgi:ABC-type antimicrobial peptide transport system permease subunit